MAVSSASTWAVSSGIRRGISVEERFTGTYTKEEDLLTEFRNSVKRKLNLDYTYNGNDVSTAARGLQFMLKEKLENHQMQRRKLWKERTDYSSLSEASCSINDNRTTELFMFKIYGGVEITEQYRFFLRFIKYKADINWCVMSLKGDTEEGQKLLRNAFNFAQTDKSGKVIGEAMNALKNPTQKRIENPTSYAQKSGGYAYQTSSGKLNGPKNYPKRSTETQVRPLERWRECSPVNTHTGPISKPSYSRPEYVYPAVEILNQPTYSYNYQTRQYWNEQWSPSLQYSSWSPPLQYNSSPSSLQYSSPPLQYSHHNSWPPPLQYSSWPPLLQYSFWPPPL